MDIGSNGDSQQLLFCNEACIHGYCRHVCICMCSISINNTRLVGIYYNILQYRKFTIAVKLIQQQYGKNVLLYRKTIHYTKSIQNTHTSITVTCFSSWGKGHQTDSNGSNKEQDLHDDFLQVKSSKQTIACSTLLFFPLSQKIKLYDFLCKIVTF